MWPVQLTAGLFGVSVLGAQGPLSTFARTDPDDYGYGLGLSTSMVSIVIGGYVVSMLVGAGLLTGCVDNAPGDLSASASAVLRPAVQDVRQAAATGTYADLKDAVASLKSLVEQQESDGEISADRATAIEDAADVLLNDARPSPKPTPTVTTASPTPTVTSCRWPS